MNKFYRYQPGCPLRAVVNDSFDDDYPNLKPLPGEVVQAGCGFVEVGGNVKT